MKQDVNEGISLLMVVARAVTQLENAQTNY